MDGGKLLAGVLLASTVVGFLAGTWFPVIVTVVVVYLMGHLLRR